MNNQKMLPQCQEAEPYYYDYLQGKEDAIPQSILTHMTDCPDCQTEIKWLKKTFAESEEGASSNTKATLHATQMKQHCILIDHPVRCSTIKSYLPILAIPEMTIRISTPVTAHIQACPECSRDLETLKRLSLSSEQLSTLSLILTQMKSEKSQDAEIITDRFFQDVQDASKSIRRIMDRPDSGIVTTFRADDSSATSEEPYHVEVAQDDIANPSSEPSTDIRLTKAPAAHSKWFFKPVAAAAAIILVAMLFFKNPSLDATDLGQIYEALKNVRNVIMTQYDVDSTESVQQILIARSQGIKLLKTGSDVILFDIQNKIKKTMNADDQLQQTDLDRDTVKFIAETMNVPYGLLPFNSSSELPEGAVWKKVELEESKTPQKQVEIYDLFWSKRTIGAEFEIHYQWRCHLDPATKHPFRLEFLRKGPGDMDYQLITTTQIDYPSESQINKMIEQISL